MDKLPPQAYKLASKQTIAPPGGKLTRVIKPAPDIPPDSKRADIIEKAEDDLEAEMETLKEETRLHNLEIERRLEEIREKGRKWEAMLNSEVQSRNDAHESVLSTFKQTFATTNSEISKTVDSTFNKIVDTDIPPQSQREVDLNSEFRLFVDVTVPSIIEKLQGSVTRQLKKSHETFEIDNTKLLKREARIIERFTTHEKTTDMAFKIEIKKRFETFLSIDEEIHSDVMRVHDRASEKVFHKYVSTITALRKDLKAEANVRETEDLELLDKLGSAMAALQQSILTNFGSVKKDL